MKKAFILRNGESILRSYGLNLDDLQQQQRQQHNKNPIIGKIKTVTKLIIVNVTKLGYTLNGLIK